MARYLLYAYTMPNWLARFLHRPKNAVIPRICGDGTLLAWGAKRLWAEHHKTHPHSPAPLRKLRRVSGKNAPCNFPKSYSVKVARREGFRVSVLKNLPVGNAPQAFPSGHEKGSLSAPFFPTLSVLLLFCIQETALHPQK